MNSRREQHSKEVEAAVDRLQEQDYSDFADFNAWLDADGDVNVAGASFKPSEIWYYLDPTGYRAEYDRWLREDSERYQIARELLGRHDNRANINHLVEVAKRDRVVPFVGAGCSAPCGKKLWGAYLLQLAGQCAGVTTADIQAAMDRGEFEAAAERLYAAMTPPRFRLALENHFKRQPHDPFKGPLERLPSLARGCIITTNFDDILETHFHGLGRGFTNVMTGTQENDFVKKLLAGEPGLLKLHGNFESEATHVFTASQYEAAYGPRGAVDFARPLPRVLRQIYISHSLLFLGCSLGPDRTLDLFKQVLDSGHYIVPWHYAILPEPENNEPERQRRETLLTERRIRPIWYPVDDASVKHAAVEHLLDYVLGRIEGRVSAL